MRFSQAQLIGAILLWLSGRGVKGVTDAQVNAVIAAANAIIAALESEGDE